MALGWLRRKVNGRFRKGRVRRRRRAHVDMHYEAHKERARILIHERLMYWNQFYGLTYNRVAIRNQRSRWGSCSTKKNLNFNYRLAFLPIELVDYVVVHELCHLTHFNHGSEFWLFVEKTIPDYEKRKNELHRVTLNIESLIATYPTHFPLQTIEHTK